MSRRKSPVFLPGESLKESKKLEKMMIDKFEEQKQEISRISELLQDIQKKVEILSEKFKEEEKIEEEIFMHGLKKSQYDYLAKFG